MLKGGDWYDKERYIRKGIPLNPEHFLMRAKDRLKEIYLYGSGIPQAPYQEN
jgi:hypothetical protein